MLNVMYNYNYVEVIIFVTFKYILKVGGEVKITVRILKDSIKDSRVTTQNGKKSAVEIPRRAVNAEILRQIDKCKY